MPVIPFVLTAADRRILRLEDLPALPAWAVPDPADRQRQAVEQAAQGPFDGIRGLVDCDPNDGPPGAYRTPDDQWVYTLDRKQSGATLVVYRYDPAASRSHAAAMRAVVEAYDERGPRYLEEARQ